MLSYIPVLTVAGSDSSGGAGIQADLKTMSALGCYGMSAITAITAQNTCGVMAVQGIDPEVVAAQIDAVYADIPPLAVKTGMLFSKDIVGAVSVALRRYRPSALVVDPVMVSTSGSRLISEDAVESVVSEIFPLATLVTPNKAEAEVLTGHADVTVQAARLHEMGAAAVLLKGGDDGCTDVKTDWLSVAGGELIRIEARAVDSRNTHGTGCTLSSAIASYMALGHDVVTAVRLAKAYITKALEAGAPVSVGGGHGPVNHFFEPSRLKVYDHKD